MKRLVICTLFFATFTAPVHAADCIEKACIEVYTQNGTIVIEGRKGTGPIQKKSVAPAPRKPRAPVVRKTVKPTVKPKPKPKVVTSTKKPIVKKRVRTSSSAPATSLSDKLVEMLPTAGIAYSPSFSPLIQVPVYFWSDIPLVVVKKIEIVGEIVEVRLKPTFLWHFGDGVIFLTKKSGGPFPDGEIRHSYSRAGHYVIQLITSWDGEFTVQGVTSRIPGKIESVSALPISVVAAPSRFSPPVLFKR